MPQCINCDMYYTGKEPSPRGLGYHASAEQIGQERIGQNNRLWHVTTFGVRRIQRWRQGSSSTSQYIHDRQVFAVPECPREVELGLCKNVDRVYDAQSWCPYSYIIQSPTRIQIIKSDMCDDPRPVSLNEFWMFYRKHNSKDGLHHLSSSSNFSNTRILYSPKNTCTARTGKCGGSSVCVH